MTKKNTRGEIRLLRPRWVAADRAQRDEAVSLLAELPLDVAAKRRGLRFGSANDGAPAALSAASSRSRRSAGKGVMPRDPA